VSTEGAVVEALPSVSVIVATYNRRENLPMVVESLLADPATTELLIVVDGCRDGSLELLEDRALSEPRLKPLFIENRGLAGAQQVGVEHAAGEVVLLLDDDVIATPGLVTGHARRHTQEDGLVVVGYMPIRDCEARGHNRSASYLYSREYDRACEAYERAPDQVLRALWGGNVSLRRSDCLRLSVVNDAFGEQYHMDWEFGLRCFKAGLQGVFSRALLAEHAHVRSFDGVLRDARNQGAGKVVVHRLHGDVVGSLDPSLFEASLPAPARWTVRLSRRPVARWLVVALLVALAHLAARLRIFPIELRTMQLLRRIEMQRGALRAGASPPK
jgi:hypothetical protein